MVTGVSTDSRHHRSQPDTGVPASDASPIRLRAQFGLEPDRWSVSNLRPGSFTIQGEAAPSGTTTTATLICADTLAVSVRAWAHPPTPDGFQRFSIVEADDELVSLLLRIAQ